MCRHVGYLGPPITLSELALETFFPADAATAALLRVAMPGAEPVAAAR